MNGWKDATIIKPENSDDVRIVYKFRLSGGTSDGEERTRESIGFYFSSIYGKGWSIWAYDHYVPIKNQEDILFWKGLENDYEQN